MTDRDDAPGAGVEDAIALLETLKRDAYSDCRSPAAATNLVLAIATVLRALKRATRPATVVETAAAEESLVRLDACPPGLFRFGATLGFRSDYDSRGTMGASLPDAYVVETGEYFWGGAQQAKDRAALMVEPVNASAMIATAPRPQPAPAAPGQPR